MCLEANSLVMGILREPGERTAFESSGWVSSSHTECRYMACEADLLVFR